MSKNNLAIWKVLGVVPVETMDTGQDIKVLCPFHGDSESSFMINHTDKEGNSDVLYDVGRCWACQGTLGNLTPARMWLKDYANLDYSDTENWRMAQKLLAKMETFKNSDATWKAARLESRDFETVKEAVLDIFDVDYLEEHSPEWEEYLENLVNSGDVFVTKQNEHVQKWSLTFAVWFGKDYNIGEVAYHPNAKNKVTTSVGTKNGFFMPWSISSPRQFKNNDEKEFQPNLLANTQEKVVIVEGQKDMLALNLLGIPAITITGGCKSLAQLPALFTNKDVYIIYDNDIAGFDGSRALGEQLMPFANSVHIATSFYKDLGEKEDAFDFLFKYKKTPMEFFQRMSDDSLFEILDAEVMAEKKKKEDAKEYQKHLRRKSIQVKTFYNIYELPMHKLFEVNARLNSFEVQASHNIYKKVSLEIWNYGDMIKNLDNKTTWKRLKAIVQKVQDSPALSQKFEITEEERKIVFTTTMTEDDMDIMEEILLETNKKSETAYLKLFKEIERTITNIILSGDKKDFVKQLTFDKESAQDYTEMFIAQDRDFEELSASKSDAPQIYSVFMPSELIKPNSKAGDKLTLIAGKLKKHKTNQPFLLGYALRYRDPIEDFEITEEIKNSLEKFKLVPGEETTTKDIWDRLNLMYKGMRLLGPDVEVYSEDLWLTLELVWSSIRRYTSVNKLGSTDSARGVLDVLMVGDSGTGKSNTVSRFIDTYRTGVVQEMSKATVLSLVGGSDIGNKNKINLGTLPMNDGGLVAFEELSGMQTPELRKAVFNDLLEIRSQGKTLISRVSDKVEVTADTRLITASNPVDITDNQVAMSKFQASSYWSAVEMLIPNVAALNRFTFFHFPVKDEIMNAPSTSDISNSLNGILPFEKEDWANKGRWIWSRKEQNTLISAELANYAKAKAEKELAPLLETDGSDIGLYSTGRTSGHLIRTAIAIAASTVSTVDFEQLIVKEVHIDAAVEWFKRIYHEKTGIPKMVAARNKATVASVDDINVILGKSSLGAQHAVFESYLTFGSITTPQAKGILFDLYEELHSQMTNASGGNLISWKLIEPYLVQLSVQAQAVGASVDDRGNALQAAWRLALKKLGVISEHATKDRVFVLQPKFIGIFAEIENYYRGGEV